MLYPCSYMFIVVTQDPTVKFARLELLIEIHTPTNALLYIIKY